MVETLLDDVFRVERLDPDGKKFDRGFRNQFQILHTDSEELFKSWIASEESNSYNSPSIVHQTPQATSRMGREHNHITPVDDENSTNLDQNSFRVLRAVDGTLGLNFEGFDAVYEPMGNRVQNMANTSESSVQYLNGRNKQNGTGVRAMDYMTITDDQKPKERLGLGRCGSATSFDPVNEGEATKKRRVERSKKKDSEQTKELEELQLQNYELTEEKTRLLEEIERIIRSHRKVEQDHYYMQLDVNSDIYPLRVGKKFKMVLAPTLNLDGTPDTGYYTPGGRKTFADDFEYVMHGKLYKISDSSGPHPRVEMCASFGGLLMLLIGDPTEAQKFELDQKMFLLIRKV